MPCPLFLRHGNIQPLANFLCQYIGNFDVTRHGLQNTVNRVLIKRMPCAFPFEHTSVKPRMPEKFGTLHSTTTVSLIASAGTPFKASSSLS